MSFFRIFLFLLLTAWADALPLRFVLLPLDNRPCNLLFVRQIGRIAQAEVVAPSSHWLGSWLNAGQCELFPQWLLETAKPGDTFLISSDMLCYGGLVASRNAATALDLALRRLAVLPQLKTRGVRVEVLATLPRLYLRTSEGQAPYETALATWAARGDEQFPSGVPEVFVREYLGVRSRNREVVLRLLELSAQGVVDKLVIGQDDSSARGLHYKDQEAVAARLNPRSVLLSGADELTMDMLAGRLADVTGLHPTVSLEYSEAGSERLIPPLESHPLETMVAQHVALSGARIAADSADVRIFVQVPAAHPFETPGLEQRPKSSQFVERVREWMVRGRGKTALADLAFINRADPFLAEAVIERVPLTELEAFAAWNTPANAFGTVTAQLVVRHIAEQRARHWRIAQVLESERTHLAFLLARLIDDYGYQTMVRSEFYPEARGLSPNPDPLLSPYLTLGRRVRVRLLEWARDLYARRFQNRLVELPGKRGPARLGGATFEVVLPWPRLFEVQLRMDVELVAARPLSREPRKTEADRPADAR